jgi:hypothetical protein
VGGLFQGQASLLRNGPQLGQTLNGLQSHSRFGIMLGDFGQSWNDLGILRGVILPQFLGRRRPLTLVPIGPHRDDQGRHPFSRIRLGALAKNPGAGGRNQDGQQ